METRTNADAGLPAALDEDAINTINTMESDKILEALQRLDESLQALGTDGDRAVLSWYRTVPPVIVQAQDILMQGAQLVHGTATKYTLVGKIDRKEQNKIAQDLLRGCQLVGTATLLFHSKDDGVGCGPSSRRYVRQAARAICRTVAQLVQSFVDGSALQENVGAQKTGSVWATCDAVIQKRIPIGNRNAIRRDLLTYSIECKETIDEFEAMLQESEGEAAESKDNKQDNTNNDSWDDFLQGDTDRYSSSELPIAQAGVFLVKSTRGCLNVALQSCEAVGSALGTIAEDQEDNPANRSAQCEWLTHLVELARAVGDGMTDLGATLYPPLDLDQIEEQVQSQCTHIGALLQHVRELPPTTDVTFPAETTELIEKVETALTTRQEEARAALERARQAS